jgi:hypothetical protein
VYQHRSQRRVYPEALNKEVVQTLLDGHSATVGHLLLEIALEQASDETKEADAAIPRQQLSTGVPFLDAENRGEPRLKGEDFQGEVRLLQQGLSLTAVFGPYQGCQ